MKKKYSDPETPSPRLEGILDPYAGFWLRVGASLTDGLLLLIPAVLSFWLLPTNVETVVTAEGPMRHYTLTPFSSAVFGFIVLLYKAGFEGSERRGTIGKMVMKLQVTDLKGQRLGYGSAAVRSWPIWLPWVVPFGAYSWVVSLLAVGSCVAVAKGPRKQGWHDRMARALVVCQGTVFETDQSQAESLGHSLHPLPGSANTLGGIALISSDSVDDIGSPQPAHWGFWGTVIWGTAILVIHGVLQIITILVVAASRNGHLSQSELMRFFISAREDGYLLSLTTFVTTVVCCGLVVGVIKLKNGSLLTEYLCIRSVSLRMMLRWLGFLMGFIVLSDLITILLGRPIVPPFVRAVYATANPLWTIWVAIIIAAPLFEETFFRGFLFKGLESSFMGPIGAVLVTASLWAALHVQYDLYGVATIFCFGLLLGVARVFTGSLLVPLGLHAAASLVATIEAATLG